MAITGRQRCDRRRLAQDLEHLCNEHIALFGTPAPLEGYLFLTLAVGEGYGGLEHADSCSLICTRDDLPQPGMDKPTEGYRRFLGLCSHEYFHLWNVKRIKPTIFVEPDLTREAHTSLLWAFEGITSYYDDLALVRSQCIEPSNYLELMAQNVTRVMRASGRLRQSVAESSFDAWTKFYKQDENAPNAIVSYYTKGGLIAFGLDVTLREMTDGRASLDDLMRELWRRFGQTGRGVEEDTIERLASELVGTDLSEFFAEAVYGTEELPLERWFGSVGVAYRLRPAATPDEPGGFIEKLGPVEARGVLGARFKAAGDLVELTHVFEGGAAQAAGLAAGDRLVAVDGIQAKADTLAARIAGLPKGQPVTVHALRRDELMTFGLLPQPAPADTSVRISGAARRTGSSRAPVRLIKSTHGRHPCAPAVPGRWAVPLGRGAGRTLQGNAGRHLETAAAITTRNRLAAPGRARVWLSARAARGATGFGTLECRAERPRD
jgi:predicted metalloprotease with PDZ domain